MRIFGPSMVRSMVSLAPISLAQELREAADPAERYRNFLLSIFKRELKNGLSLYFKTALPPILTSYSIIVTSGAPAGPIPAPVSAQAF